MKVERWVVLVRVAMVGGWRLEVARGGYEVAYVIVIVGVSDLGLA